VILKPTIVPRQILIPAPLEPRTIRLPTREKKHEERLGMNRLLKGVGFARFLVSESTPSDYSTEILAIERAQRCKFS
jgi:hypothetical protein